MYAEKYMSNAMGPLFFGNILLMENPNWQLRENEGLSATEVWQRCQKCTFPLVLPYASNFTIKYQLWKHDADSLH